jgi:predicted RNA-binding protein with TRAM domain
MTTERGRSFTIGERHSVTIEKIAHGGHFIARHEGQVIFVRHAIPGETVEVEITSTGSSFVRADAVRIIVASPDRVSPPCPYSHPGGCGGCDFQHISLPRQRRLKEEVGTIHPNRQTRNHHCRRRNWRTASLEDSYRIFDRWRWQNRFLCITHASRNSREGLHHCQFEHTFFGVSGAKMAR